MVRINFAIPGDVSRDDPVLIAGGGGFIGGWVCRELLSQGFSDVRCVDIKPLTEWHQRLDGARNSTADLSRREKAEKATQGVRYLFNFAADMGGMGFIELNKAACMLSVLINTHLLEASRLHGVERFFFASSACVYNAGLQETPEVLGLREQDAYPAMPEDGYGWEKLFSERMVRHFEEDFGIQGRVARFHNIYGPEGTWFGGREKAPAAIARKVATAKLTGQTTIEIWGDGGQTRSFTFVDDAVEGVLRLMWSDINVPINIGSDEMVSINELVSLVEDIAGTKLNRIYDLDAPKGVRGRNSDNTLISTTLGWAPATTLRDGMSATYHWVEEQVSIHLEQT